MNKKFFLLFLILILGGVWQLLGQQVAVQDPTGALHPLWWQLQDSTRLISIAHVGDSHVQAGSFTIPLRNKLLRQYGGAGYGWVGGHPLYGSNQSSEIRFNASPYRWSVSKLTDRNGTSEPGPGGLVFSLLSGMHSIRMESRIGERYAYALVYRSHDTKPMRGFYRCQLLGTEEIDNICVDTLDLGERTGSITLQGSSRNAQYYGWQLLSKLTGPVVHAIGLNGARFDQFATAAFGEGLSMLCPQLIIVSLGTNDAYSKRWDPAFRKGFVRQMVRMLRRTNPDAAILLTTPPPCYFRTSYVAGRRKRRKIYRQRLEPNPNTVYMARIIMEVAREEGVAAYDLFTALGGNEQIDQLKRAGMISSDGVHYSHEGYRRQGELLTEALLKAVSSAAMEPLSSAQGSITKILRQK